MSDYMNQITLIMTGVIFVLAIIVYIVF